MKFLSAILLLCAMFIATACSQAPPNTFPFPENLWVDAENYVRGNKDIEYHVGPISRLEQNRIEFVPNGRQRTYFFLVEAAKGSGEIAVEYRFSDGVWEARRWDYKMGFPPPNRDGRVAP